jgi:hypothetical protein
MIKTFKAVNVSRIEFNQYLWNGLENAWRNMFMALYKPGFIMEQYG